MTEPDVCPFCASKLKLRRRTNIYWHVKDGCILWDFEMDNDPEDIALWNRRVGKPLWAEQLKAEPK